MFIVAENTGSVNIERSMYWWPTPETIYVDVLIVV